ncbi:MAG: ATP-binding protein [Eubacteriales bacterium]|nr:ATP-binding protein [Eubacteriales bacterium]
MADTFFSGLDDAALRALLERTALNGAALLTVGPTLHIESHSEAAARLTGLRPLERVDQLLSEAAVAALRDCIARQTPRTLYEELDGAEYRLELVPHRDGALLAFLRDDRASYDGSLRVLHAKSAQCLGALMSDIRRLEDGALSENLRKQCLRMHRILTHSDFLHDPPLTEQLRLTYCDLGKICRSEAREAAARTQTPVTVAAAESCTALVEPRLIRIALCNLLANAVSVTKADGDIALSLHDDGAFITVTVADRGPGLDAALFGTLLAGWQRSVPLDDYLALARQGAALGLGLPITQRIALLHGGSLLLSPREGGGSELHLSIAHLPASLADHNLHAPMILEEEFTLEEIEFSVL